MKLFIFIKMEEEVNLSIFNLTPKDDRTIRTKRYSRSKKVFIFKFINLFYLMEGNWPESGIIFPLLKQIHFKIIIIFNKYLPLS